MWTGLKILLYTYENCREISNSLCRSPVSNVLTESDHSRLRTKTLRHFVYAACHVLPWFNLLCISLWLLFSARNCSRKALPPPLYVWRGISRSLSEIRVVTATCLGEIKCVQNVKKNNQEGNESYLNLGLANFYNCISSTRIWSRMRYSPVGYTAFIYKMYRI